MATGAEEIGHRHPHAGHPEAGALGGQQAEQEHLFAALEVVGLLVGRGRLKIALVEVPGQEGKLLVLPGLVVGAGETDPCLPVFAQRAEGHGLEIAMGRIHRLAELLYRR